MELSRKLNEKRKGPAEARACCHRDAPLAHPHIHCGPPIFSNKQMSRSIPDAFTDISKIHRDSKERAINIPSTPEQKSIRVKQLSALEGLQKVPQS